MSSLTYSNGTSRSINQGIPYPDKYPTKHTQCREDFTTILFYRRCVEKL
jgi:hypothetical protein